MTWQKVRQKYQERRLFWNLVLLSVLFFAHCFWGDMMYVAFPILAVMVIFDSLENGLSYIAFSLPFCFLNIYISAILMLSCALLYMAKYYFIRFFREKQKPSIMASIFILLFFVYCFLPIGEYNLNKFIHIFLFACLFLFLSMLLQRPEIFRMHFNIKILAFAVLLASVFSLSYFFSPYLQNYLEISGVNDNLPRFMALFYHANVLAMFCELVLSILTYYIMQKKANKWDIVLFVGIMFVGILTFSKTYFLILIFLLLVILIWQLCTNFKKTAIIASVLVVVVVLFCFTFPQFLQIMQERFFGTIDACETFADFMNMLTTTRYNVWTEYCGYLSQNPLALVFGAGLGAPVINVYSPHNGYLAVVYEFGIVGAILFGLSLFFVFKSSKQKLHWSAFVPIFVIALMFLVEDFIFYIFI